MKHLSFTTLLFVLFLTLSTACFPKVVESVRVERRDSLVVQVREHLVTDTVTIEIPREVEKVVVPMADTSRLENRFARSEAFIDTLGLLHHSLESKAQSMQKEVQVAVKDSTIYSGHFESQSYISKTVIEKPLTAWQRFRLFAFYVLLAMVPLAACWKTWWPWAKKLWPLIRKIVMKI